MRTVGLVIGEVEATEEPAESTPEQKEEKAAAPKKGGRKPSEK